MKIRKSIMANVYTKKSFLPKTTNQTDFGYLNGTFKFQAKKIEESKKVQQVITSSLYLLNLIINKFVAKLGNKNLNFLKL